MLTVRSPSSTSATPISASVSPIARSWFLRSATKPDVSQLRRAAFPGRCATSGRVIRVVAGGFLAGLDFVVSGGAKGKWNQRPRHAHPPRRAALAGRQLADRHHRQPSDPFRRPLTEALNKQRPGGSARGGVPLALVSCPRSGRWRSRTLRIRSRPQRRPCRRTAGLWLGHSRRPR
jgi:hypothetical protein